MTTRANKNFSIPDASGKPITEYEFGGVTFHVTAGKAGKIVINGMCNDKFYSEQELLAAYDDTGQGVDLVRVYADGSRVKLRPKAPPSTPPAEPAPTELGA